jgi:hypothetical protein
MKLKLSTIKVRVRLNEYGNCAFDHNVVEYTSKKYKSGAFDLIDSLRADFDKWNPHTDPMIRKKEEMNEELEYYEGQIIGSNPLTYNQIDGWFYANGKHRNKNSEHGDYRVINNKVWMERFLAYPDLSKGQRHCLIDRY